MSEYPVTTQLRPVGVERRPIGWWGMALTAMVLATTYAAMYFSYVYIRVGVDLWPPEGIAAPPLDLAAASAAALAVSAAPVWFAGRRELAGDLLGMRVGLAIALLLAAVHAGLLAADWARAPFAVDVHAYASLYYVLPAIHVFVLAIAATVAAVLIALSLKDTAADQRHVGLTALALFWYTVSVGGVALLVTVYVIPHVWPRA